VFQRSGAGKPDLQAIFLLLLPPAALKSVSTSVAVSQMSQPHRPPMMNDTNLLTWGKSGAVQLLRPNLLATPVLCP